MSLQTIRNSLSEKKGQAKQIQGDLNSAISKQEGLEKEIVYSEKAQAIIQVVAKKTQEELQYRIEEPVSLALAAIYDDPYKLNARFEITGRGTTECHLGFERNGNIINPLKAAGGGTVDVASLGLRLSSWSLAKPRSRPVMLLDEPFKWIDKEKVGNSETTTMHLAGEFLRGITKPPPKGLGLQIIMITHIKELIDCADRIIRVSKKDNISTVEVK